MDDRGKRDLPDSPRALLSVTLSEPGGPIRAFGTGGHRTGGKEPCSLFGLGWDGGRLPLFSSFQPAVSSPQVARHSPRVDTLWPRWSAEKRIVAIATGVFALDQFTKLIVVYTLPQDSQREVLRGFFRWVHWGNTGAAWSQFHGYNSVLAVVAVGALAAFWHWRRQFEADRTGGQIALGCLMGGIVGNLLDRLARGHVVDFLRFYWSTRSGDEIGFPAFNVADMGITTSVTLLILLAWQAPARPPNAAATAPVPARKP